MRREIFLLTLCIKHYGFLLSFDLSEEKDKLLRAPLDFREQKHFTASWYPGVSVSNTTLLQTQGEDRTGVLWSFL